ncbi:GntR family transcriptional regulator [Nakamurella lactea]|uniref:GntR family transcriptional regulator n=1 Tax=Nakamurella lactea TaxID=459515 RepID=UPI0012B57228|nr:GntR family transcriptional regulator [Nakamurella lactea]
MSDMPSAVGAGEPSGHGLRAIAERPSRTREIYEELRLAIARRDLQPGSLYSVADLAETFGVSRTPVREALIDLAARNIIKFERNRGVRILQSSAEDLRDIFDLRLILETHAARRAAENLDEVTEAALREAFDALELATAGGDDLVYWSSDRAFHRVLVEACGNHRLSEIVEGLRDSILVKGATSSGRTRSLQTITDDHREIFEAVVGRDPDGAVTAMRKHLEQTARQLLKSEHSSP